MLQKRCTCSLQDYSMEQVDAQRSLWPHGKPMLEQTPDRTCGFMERGHHAGAGLLSELVTPQGTQAGAIPEGLKPVEWTCSGVLVKNCSPWERFTLDKFVEDTPLG
ncbi:hypothetical protein DUI87_10385 [Hirundo rustica rustica]|uniref:Uncharacterized protein n=1 Tax=Hirundo rustica rustica TaxID=333673 RepID=A0A3M0KPC1_HIRRU|nr:hypothetical protein DUI87_10385 [Hirundo rustica rustica]